MSSNQTFKTPALLMKAAGFALAAILFCAFAAVDSYGQRTSAKKRQAKSPRSNATTLMVMEAEQLLSELGYWTGPIDGKMDVASRHALIAFQKVEGREMNGRVTAGELEALRGAKPPAPLERGDAHIEVDLARQVLFVVDQGGTVSKVLPISSGNGEEFTSEGWTRRAITPTGRFKVNRKIDGKRKSPLGMLYYPNYFLSGIAIHGAPSVPTRPASHGCIRIPMFAAKPLHDLVPVGTPVIVHGDSGVFAQGKGGSAQR